MKLARTLENHALGLSKSAPSQRHGALVVWLAASYDTRRLAETGQRLKRLICVCECHPSPHSTEQCIECSVHLGQVYLLNEPEDAVTEMLDGIVASVPHLRRLDGFPEAGPAWSEHTCLVLVLLPVTMGKAYRQAGKLGTGQGGRGQLCPP